MDTRRKAIIAYLTLLLTLFFFSPVQADGGINVRMQVDGMI